MVLHVIRRAAGAVGRVGVFRFAVAMGGAVAMTLLLAPPALAQTVPSGFNVTTLPFTNAVNAGGGAASPATVQPVTAVRFARDGRVYLAEKSGRVLEFDNVLDTTGVVIADLRTQVHNFWDRGLLGLALDPDFPDAPHLYVIYTHDGGAAVDDAPRWGTPGATGDGCPTPPGATADNGGCVAGGRVSRLTLAGGVATEEVLLRDWYQQYPSHSVGTVLIGQDGFLYAGGGDGASFNWTDWGQRANPNYPDTDSPLDEGGALRAQDIRTRSDPLTLSGTVVRVDRSTGEPAPGNPLHVDPTATLNERRVIAHGFRNPFRFTVKPGTNEIWLGDVGLGTWEEIDVIGDLESTPATLPVPNFGWPCYEGAPRQGGYDGANKSLCETLYAPTDPNAVRPFYAYRHNRPSSPTTCASTGSAISGLAHYRGTSYPPQYANALFFADYNRDEIFAALDTDADGTPNPPPANTAACASTPEPSMSVFAGNGGGVQINAVDLQTGPGGDLFWAALDQARVYRIHYGTNRSPSAALRLAAGSTARGAARSVTLDASASIDPDTSDVLSYAWDLDGDGAYDDLEGQTATTATVALTAGTVRVGLRVSDGSASDAVSMRLIAGNAAPIPVIDAPGETVTFDVGDILTAVGHANDPEDGNVSPASLTWDVLLEHCSDEAFTDCHTHPVTSFPGDRGPFEGYDHDYPAYLRLRLTATDAEGASTSVERAIFPNVVDVPVATTPTGLAIIVGNDDPQAAPFSHRAMANGSVSLIAVTPQLLGGVEHEFVSWSDGGDAAHDVRYTTSPASPLVATYRPIGDLAVSLTGAPTATRGTDYVYTLTVSAEGDGGALGAALTTTLPASLSTISWTCVASAGASCTTSGTGAPSDVVSLPPAGSVVYTISGEVPIAATAALEATASIALAAGYRNVDGTDDNVALSTPLGATPPPVVTIATPGAGATWKTGEEVMFSGDAADWRGFVLDGGALSWSITLHECSDETLATCTTSTLATASGASGSIIPPEARYPAFIRYSLTATDALAQTTTATRDVMAALVDATFTAAPPGVAIAVDGASASSTPVTRRLVANAGIDVDAPSPQTIGGIEHEFVAWSDDGAASHIARFPNAGAATLTATFRPYADVALSLSGAPTANPGSSYTWTLVVTAQGTGGLAGAGVTTSLPAAVGQVTWSCTASAGSTCAATGAGAPVDTIALASGGSATYTIVGTLASNATGPLAASATASLATGYRETDANDNTAGFEATIAATDSPTIAIATPSAATTWRTGEVLAFSATANDWLARPLTNGALAWTVALRECTDTTYATCTDAPIAAGTGATANVTMPPARYPAQIRYRVTATDERGASATATRDFLPKSAAITVATEVGGVSTPFDFRFDGTTYAATTTRTVVVGTPFALEAITPQQRAGVTYDFVAWSDGGAAARTAAADDENPRSFIATYTARTDAVFLDGFE